MSDPYLTFTFGDYKFPDWYTRRRVDIGHDLYDPNCFPQVEGTQFRAYDEEGNSYPCKMIRQIVGNRIVCNGFPSDKKMFAWEDQAKIRPHRGGLEESVREMVSVDPTFKSLAAYLSLVLNKVVTPEMIVVELYANWFDSRVKWSRTYLVRVRGELFGFIDRPPAYPSFQDKELHHAEA